MKPTLQLKLSSSHSNLTPNYTESQVHESVGIFIDLRRNL